MLVTKNVFCLTEVGDLSLQEIEKTCMNNFLNHLKLVNEDIRLSKEEQYDREVLLSKYSKAISFDTDSIKFETSLSCDYIVEANKDIICTENQERLKQKDARINFEASDDDTKVILGLDEQCWDVLELAEKDLQIKILNIANKDYFCYTV